MIALSKAVSALSAESIAEVVALVKWLVTYAGTGLFILALAWILGWTIRGAKGGK